MFPCSSKHGLVALLALLLVDHRTEDSVAHFVSVIGLALLDAAIDDCLFEKALDKLIVQARKAETLRHPSRIGILRMNFQAGSSDGLDIDNLTMKGTRRRRNRTPEHINGGG